VFLPYDPASLSFAVGSNEIREMSVIGFLRDVKTLEDVFELIDGRNSVGRGDGNEIKISSRSVSNNHAVIEIDVSQRQFYMAVKDLGSRNATWVNEVIASSIRYDYHLTLRRYAF
jgi:hypothetical protein